MRKRRLDLRLSQREVAQFFKMTVVGYQHWELNWTNPCSYKKPMIEKFLGYKLPREISFESHRRKFVQVQDDKGRFVKRPQGGAGQSAE